jgi:hypothetical protein
MSGFSIFGSNKPYIPSQSVNDSYKCGAYPLENSLIQFKKYQKLDRILNFDGYIISIDRIERGKAWIYVNAKLHFVDLKSGSNSEIYFAIKQKIDAGQFASRFAKPSCFPPDFEKNATIIAGHPISKPQDLPNLPNFKVGDKKTVVLSRDFSLEGIIKTAACSQARNNGKLYENLKIYSHGDSGKIDVGNHWVQVQSVIERLCNSGLMAKNATIEFRGCLVGQDFKALRACAIKHNINIVANNYLAIEGVAIDPDASYKKKKYRNFYDWAKVPKVPETITYNSNGVVVGEKSGDITRRGIIYEV